MARASNPSEQPRLRVVPSPPPRRAGAAIAPALARGVLLEAKILGVSYVILGPLSGVVALAKGGGAVESALLVPLMFAGFLNLLVILEVISSYVQRRNP